MSKNLNVIDDSVLITIGEFATLWGMFESHYFDNDASGSKILSWPGLNLFLLRDEEQIFFYAEKFRIQLVKWFDHQRYSLSSGSVKAVLLSKKAEEVLSSHGKRPEKLEKHLESVVAYLKGENKDMHECLYCISRVRDNMFHGLKSAAYLDTQQELIQSASDVLARFIR